MEGFLCERARGALAAWPWTRRASQAWSTRWCWGRFSRSCSPLASCGASWGQGGLQRASERVASHAIEGAGAVDGIRDLVLF